MTDFDSMAKDLMGLDDSTLRGIYPAYGHFYFWENGNGVNYPCRSILEIFRSGAAREGSLPDAIFIMMNPGGSTPASTEHAIPQVWKTGEAPLLTCGLQLTNPDDTQTQLMRIMEGKGWTHVRVLNLSDLCESDSRVFCRCFPEFEAATGTRVHSVFSGPRRGELAVKLQRKEGAPVIAAWGVDRKLRPLVELCAVALKGTELTGYQNARQCYYHPLPPSRFDPRRLKQQAWVAEILRKLHAGSR